MGITPLPTDMAQDQKLSGKGIDKLTSSGQRGSFHLVDGYELMVERVGVILEDLMDKTLDTARDVPVRKSDDSAAIVRINDPIATIAQIAGAPKAAMLLAKSVKLKQLGPIGDEIAELLAPPMPQGPNGKPLSPDAQALFQENEQLKQQLQQATQTIQTKVAEKQVETQGKLQVVQAEGQIDLQKAALDREVKLAVAEIQAQSKQALQDMALFYEERARIGAQIHERAQGGAELAHDAHVARNATAATASEKAKDRLHEVLLAEQGHRQQLEQGDHAAAHASDAAQQQADLAPEPAGTGE
jgi:hypothetical protein